MVIENVFFTTYDHYEPFVIKGKEMIKALKPYIKNKRLTENLNDLRKVAEIIDNHYGYSLVISADGNFEFFDGNY